ncbi:MAG: hypothetical protein HYV97_02290 [Bdellovibrio sp.]|nr:hypothetical protein [Bdellovibrio sp.]
MKMVIGKITWPSCFCASLCLLLALCNCSQKKTADSTLASRTWHHPSGPTDNISPDVQHVDSANGDRVKVAIAGNGDAIIAWIQSNGSANRLFVSTYSAGTWTNPNDLTDIFSVEGGTAPDSFHVAADANGNGIVVWSQGDGTNSQIFKSQYSNGTWTHPTGLSDNISPNTRDAFAPIVAMDDDGNAIIVWIQSDGANAQVFKSEYRNGAWSHPSSLADNISPDTQDVDLPRVAMDNNGNAIITWLQNDGTDLQVFKSEYRSAAWTHPAILNDNISPAGSSPSDLQVGMDDSGNAIIVWIQNDGTNEALFKSEYRSALWTHPSGATDNFTLDGSDVLFFDLATGQGGDMVVAFTMNDGSDDHVFKSEYRQGVWSHPSTLTDKISPSNNGALEHPRVAVDAEGNSIIVWAQNDDTDLTRVLLMSEYRAGTWTHPISNSTSKFTGNIGFCTYPRAAFNDDGASIIAWLAFDDQSVVQIFKSEYR